MGRGDNCGVSPGEATGVPSSNLSFESAGLLNSTSKLFGTLPIRISLSVLLSSSVVSNDEILPTSDEDPECCPFVSLAGVFLGRST